MRNFLLTVLLATSCTITFAQKIDLVQHADQLESENATFNLEKYLGKRAIKVIPSDAETEAKFIKLNSTDFKNGTIEIDVAGKRAADAGDGARGFVGLAFRIDENNTQFECFYIRPTNGRANDQVRRNHSVQYISYPDHPWYKLRNETPSKYEAYADLVEGEWTHLRLVVQDDHAELYVNQVKQPTLLVNDLKLGPDQSGKLGLWVGPGTEAYFSNLEITKK